jgi:hypothetical protein
MCWPCVHSITTPPQAGRRVLATDEDATYVGVDFLEQRQARRPATAVETACGTGPGSTPGLVPTRYGARGRQSPYQQPDQSLPPGC